MLIVIFSEKNDLNALTISKKLEVDILKFKDVMWLI